MTALILLSHGSRVDASNREMMMLATTMAGIENIPFTQVRCAFQQFATPTFETVVDDLVQKEVKDIIVLPLFLSAGSHVQEDVPALIKAAQHQFPQLSLRVTPHLGGMKDLAAFLLNSVVQHASLDV